MKPTPQKQKITPANHADQAVFGFFPHLPPSFPPTIKPRKSREVSLGRVSILEPLGSQLLDVHSPRLRGRAVATLINQYAGSVDVPKLIDALDEVRRLGLLIHQSLRCSGGRTVDVAAATAAINLVNSLRS